MPDKETYISEIFWRWSEALCEINVTEIDLIPCSKL